MASNSISPNRGLEGLLKEGQLVKQRVSVIVERFSGGPDSPLDGSIHPALQQPDDLAIVKIPAAAHTELIAADGASDQESATTVANTLTTAKPQDTDVEEELFKSAMREYEATAKPKYRTGVDPDGEHCVDELWAIIDEAGKKYRVDDTKGAWGKVRLAFRKLGENSHAAEGWLGLLPHESHYLSVVCGGLKLVLHAAARMYKVADLVLEKLSEIPLILSGTRRVLNIFRDSTELQSYSKALYKSILSAIGHMLHYLQRKSTGKTIKAFFSQENFETGLVDKINEVSKRRDSFNEQAELCHKEALKRLEETTRLTAETNSRNADTIKNEIRSLGLIVGAAEKERERAQRTIANAMAFMAMEQGELRREIAAMREVNLMVVQCFKRLMEANPVAIDLEWEKLNRIETSENDAFLDPRPPNRRGSVLSIMAAKPRPESLTKTRQDLLSRLDYDPDVASQDVSANYKLGSTLPLPSQDRSVFVIKSRHLSDWVDSAHSTALIVNGSAETVTPRSALSFVCARIVYVLDEIRTRISLDDSGPGTPRIIPLYFFCGQHVRHDHSWESPSGVVNSLLAQLLSQRKTLDLSGIKRSRIKEFDASDIEDSFRLFKKILSLLPVATTVFCVIDGLSFYTEDRECGEDARFLVAELIRLAGKKSKTEDGPVVKVLLTAPRRLRVGDKELEYERVSVLNVPQTLPATGGFTGVKWNLGVGGRLEKLGDGN